MRVIIIFKFSDNACSAGGRTFQTLEISVVISSGIYITVGASIAFIAGIAGFAFRAFIASVVLFCKVSRAMFRFFNFFAFAVFILFITVFALQTCIAGTRKTVRNGTGDFFAFSVFQLIIGPAFYTAVIITLFTVLGTGNATTHVVIISVKTGFARRVVRTGFTVGRTGKAGQIRVVPPIPVFTASA